MEETLERAIRDILRIGRDIRLYYDRELQLYHIGWAQQFILCYIFEHPGVSSQELSEVFLAEKSTISKGIKKLCKESYVEIKEDAQDRRMKRLYPTLQAEEVVNYIGELQEKMQEQLDRNLTSIEKNQLSSLLQKMNAITTAFEKER